MSTQQRPEIRAWNLGSHYMLRALDALSILGGLWVLVTWFPDVDSKSTIIIGLLAMVLFAVVGEFAGLYRDWRAVGYFREGGCATLVWGLTVVLLAALGQFAVASTEIALGALVFWAVTTPAFFLSARSLYRLWVQWLMRHGRAAREFAVVGANELGFELVRSIRNRPELGLRFKGFFEDRPQNRIPEMPADMQTTLGNFDQLISSAKSGEVPVVFITLPMRAEQRIREVVQRLADSTASVYIVPDFFVFQLLHSRWTDIQGIPVVSVYENPFYGVDGVVKRAFDIAAASVALLIAALPMAAVAAAIKLTSRGPVFFKQKRYGLDGREILVWKFRSMHCMENGNVVTQAKKNDSRLTPIGGFLRKTSLDELPQLFNVLLGSMSFVGPRPHATAHNEFYRQQIDGYMLRHKVKPGITGLAQVNGCRGETERLEQMERRVFYDHKYIREWSLWLDLKIIFNTIGIVVSAKNAY